MTDVRRILVVDDNVDAASLLRELLQVLGHQAESVYSGPDAIEKARSWLPQVVILDIGMPGMNGYEVAERLRNLPETKEATLIALTGWSEDDHPEEAQKAGFDHHLVKPVDIDRLSAILQ